VATAKRNAAKKKSIKKVANDRARQAIVSTPDMGELSELVGFNLAMANAIFMRGINAACSDLGVSAKQFAILSIIANNYGISQVDIAAALLTDRATMMAIVDRLEARGLISRERSKIDRRRQHLILTSHGTDVLTQARRAFKHSEQRWLRDLPVKDQAHLIATLKRLREAS
jgi:DNA-binding MarR family transcriptional regulator